MTDLQNQIELEELFNKNQVIKRIKEEFLNAGVEDALKELEYSNIEFGISLLVHMCIHKRAPLPVMVGVLYKIVLDEENPFQKASDLILEACEKNLVQWDPVSEHLILMFNITPETQKAIDLFQYPLPHVVEPKEVKTNRDTGFYTSKGSIILKKNHHEDDVVLDHINRMNRIPLSINNDVVAFQKNQWRNLDKPKDGESSIEFNKRLRAFSYYDKNMREVIASLNMLTDRIWLTHSYDKRGRVYCNG